MQYVDAWADLKQHGRLTVSGTWYEMCDDKASGNILARKSKEQPK